MLKFYTSAILLINQSNEIGEKQFSVLGSIGGQNSQPLNACTHLNFDFSKYLLIQNKFETHWSQRIGPIHDLF